MDPKDYLREVNKLENELNNLDGVKPASAPIEAPHKTGLITYLPYVGIGAAALGLLLLVKPRCLLRIVTSTNEPPQMVVDKGKLVIWWFILTVLGSIVYVVLTRFRRGQSS